MALRERLERVRRTPADLETRIERVVADYRNTPLAGLPQPGRDRGVRRTRSARVIVLDSSAVVALLEQEPGHRQVATWLEESGRTLAERAIDAWRRFGKGRHPARLTFGDCCTYALAAETGHPILCTGDDFILTDLPVLRPDDGT